MQLVINTFGASLRREGELFRISVKDRAVRVAARKVRTILITTGAHFSTDAIHLAAEHNVDVVFLDKYGHPYGRVWLARMGSTAAIRRAQLLCADSEGGMDVVRAWTSTKLQNQVDFLGELARRRPGRADEFGAAVERIRRQQENIERLAGTVADMRQQVLGAEGAAGAAYWGIIGTLPPGDFAFTNRSKHPAADPCNAMLNYAYGVLYSMVERACIIAGLDPFIGFLHTDNYGKRSLVYDLIEPFRIWADRVVLKLFTGRRCKQSMFHATSDGIVLEKEAKELLLPELEAYLSNAIRWQVKSSPRGKTRQIKRRDAIQAEAHTLANRLLGKDGGMSLPEVMETREIFEGIDEPERDEAPF